MIKKYFSATVLLVAAGITSAATLKDFPAEEKLNVALESASFQARLFELNRLAAPICPDLVSWGGGPGAHFVSAAEPRSEAERAFRKLLMERFSAQPLERVFIADPVGTPFWAAGLRAGDRLLPAESAASAAEAAASAPAPSMNPLTLQSRLDEIREKIDRARIRNNEQRKLAPTYQVRYQRGDESRTADVTTLPYCAISLAVWNSESSYAGASFQSVVITLPLLRKLDERSGLMAMAHEVAQILSGFTERDNHVVRNAVLGALFSTAKGTNPELGRNSPDDDSLMQIDRLTVMLLDPFGLTPADFRKFLEERSADKRASWTHISYTAARHISAARLAALDQLQADRAANRGWPQPAYVANELFEPFMAHLEDAKKQQWLRPLPGAARSAP